MNLWQFTGQGSQKPHMADVLMQFDTFRVHWQKCADIALDFGVDLTIINQNILPIDHTANSQPSIFAHEYAMAMLLLENEQPDALIGHSIGEYAAYVIAGLLSLEVAMELIILRGSLIGSLPLNTTGMLACLASQEDIQPHITPGKVDIAVINSPKQVVLSGCLEALSEIRTKLTEHQIRALPLNVSHGFHSSAMDPILSEFKNKAQAILQNSTATMGKKIQIISTQTTKPLLAVNSDYLCDHIRHTVLYWPVIETLLTHTSQITEVGPSPILTQILKRQKIKAQWAQTVLNPDHVN